LARVVDSLHPRLRQHGFRRKHIYWLRARAELTDVLELRPMGGWDPAAAEGWFSVAVRIGLPAIQAVIEEAAPQPGRPPVAWEETAITFLPTLWPRWDMSRPSEVQVAISEDPTVAAQRVVATLERTVLPWFASFPDLGSVFPAWRQERSRAGGPRWIVNDWACLVLAAGAGDQVEAHRMAAWIWLRSPSTSICALSDRLGLRFPNQSLSEVAASGARARVDLSRWLLEAGPEPDREVAARRGDFHLALVEGLLSQAEWNAASEVAQAALGEWSQTSAAPTGVVDRLHWDAFQVAFQQGVPVGESSALEAALRGGLPFHWNDVPFLWPLVRALAETYVAAEQLRAADLLLRWYLARLSGYIYALPPGAWTADPTPWWPEGIPLARTVDYAVSVAPLGPEHGQRARAQLMAEVIQRLAAQHPDAREIAAALDQLESRLTQS
jgi:hypothetical protein